MIEYEKVKINTHTVVKILFQLDLDSKKNNKGRVGGNYYFC